MDRLRGIVIGCGSMGRNHARVLSTLPDVELVAVVDPDAGAAASCAAAARCVAARSIAEVDDVDFAVVASPTESHAPIAGELIERSIHVLIEKPIATTAPEAETLTAAAASAGVVLAVGHIERFNPALVALRALVTDPRMISFERLSPFTPRIRDTIIMDLMVHDIDIALWIMSGYPTRIEAVGARVFSESIDVASALLEFEGGRIVTLQASRATQDKVRRVSVSEPECFIVADSVTQGISVKRHTTGEFAIDGGSALYKQVSVVETPYLDRQGEPLMLELRDFLDAIRTGRPPRVSGHDAIQAVRLAEQIEQRIGQP